MVRFGRIVIALGFVVVAALGYSTAAAQSPVSNVQTSDITEITAVVIWNTDEPRNSVVNYGTDASLGFSVSHADEVTDHAVTLASLSSDTDYLFEIEFTDAEGNTFSDDNGGELYTFTTLQAENVRRAFVGVITSLDDDSMTLVRQGSGEAITFSLEGDYVLSLPGGERSKEFVAGARVVVLAQRQADSEWSAIRVSVKPSNPVPPATGVVVSISEGEITLLETGGATAVFELPSELETPIVGDLVTAFVNSDGIATSLVKSQQVRERVQTFLEDVAEDNEAVPLQLVEILSQALVTHGNKELQIIDEALNYAPEDKKPQLLSAKNEVNRGRLISQAAVERARSRFQNR